MHAHSGAAAAACRLALSRRARHVREARRHARKWLWTDREQPTQGFYVVYPEISEESAENNKLLAAVANNTLPPMESANLAECLRGTASVALNYGGLVSKYAQKLEDPSEPRVFSAGPGPVSEELGPVLYAWAVTRQMLLYTDTSERPDEESLLLEAHRVNTAVTTNHSAVYNDAQLYRAAKEVAADASDLDAWQRRLVHRFLVEGRLNGLELSDRLRAAFDDHQSKIADVKMSFLSNVTKVYPTFKSRIDDKSVLDDAPPHVLSALADNPAEPESGPWHVRLHPGSVWHFLRYCRSREMRYNAWSAWVTRASFKQPFNNNSACIEDLRFHRQRTALLLGHDNFSQMSMATKMAGTVGNVRTFCDAMRAALKPQFNALLEAAEDYAEKHDRIDSALKCADLHYYGRKVPFATRDVDANALSGHFEFGKVRRNLFEFAARLLGIRFERLPAPTVERWHQSVVVYRITDAKTDNELALLYMEPYARRGRKTAWEAVGARGRSNVSDCRPLVFLNCWAIKGPDGKAYLHYEELQHFAREFGQSLALALSESPYAELSGGNFMEWDAAGAVPALFAKLATGPELLRMLCSEDGSAAGSPLTDRAAVEFSDAITESSVVETYRSVFWSDFDIQIYSMADRTDKFWHDLYSDMWRQYYPFPLEKGDFSPSNFAPIWTGPLPAAYYSIVWTEMLACDIESMFTERSALLEGNESALCQLGAKLREMVARGAAQPAKAAYRGLRGRDPSLEPIIKLYAGAASAHGTAAQPAVGEQPAAAAFDQQTMHRRTGRGHVVAPGIK